MDGSARRDQKSRELALLSFCDGDSQFSSGCQTTIGISLSMMSLPESPLVSQPSRREQPMPQSPDYRYRYSFHSFYFIEEFCFDQEKIVLFVVWALLGFHGFIRLCDFGNFQGMFDRPYGRHVFDDVFLRQSRRSDLFHSARFLSWLARTSSRTLESRYVSQVLYILRMHDLSQVSSLEIFSYLGFMVEFISAPVISGFCSAAALTVSSTQVKGLFGLKFKGSSFIDIWRGFFENIAKCNPWDSALGCSMIVILLLMRVDYKIFFFF